MSASGPAKRVGQPPQITFELLAEIATGPTARVELCRIRAPEKLAGKLCAVKRLHPHIAEDPHFYSMFVDEVWMTAALDHQNVAHVVGWGTDAEGTYLAVELIEGVSLARLMKTVFETREAFTERMVVYIGLEICAGLSAAHGLTSAEGELLQLVHRDLTPGNVLVGFDGRVLIADFGLAKAKQRVTKTLTGLLKGHPQYMAPEQATDAPIDGRADLFSLGVVLFELFSGRHPWNGGTEIEVFHMMAKEPPLDLATLRPKIDRELGAIVSGLLEKDPGRRFSSAAEVYERLAYWLDTHGYKDDNADAVARFVRRNAMRQMRWFERAIAGEFVSEATRAKARLLGARTRGARTLTGSSIATGPSRLTGPSSHPPPAQSSQTPARRRSRRIVDEATDVSDIASRFQNAPTSSERDATPELLGAITDADGAEPADWAEELPTVVKPNQVLSMARGAMDARKAAEQGAPLPAGPDALPSFADDESDSRTTAVKSNVAMLSGLESVTQRRQDEAARRIAMNMPLGNHGTVLNMPVVSQSYSGDESDEVPTAPLRTRRNALPKLPPPVQRPPSPAALLEKRASISDDPTTLPREKRAPARSDADVRSESERLAALSARYFGEAERAYRAASHKSTLSELASHASELANEAVRMLGQGDLAHARTLVAEAHRLEEALLRGEAEGPSSTEGEVAGPPSSDRAQPGHSFTEPQRISVPPPFVSDGRERGSQPPPPPAPPAGAFPPQVEREERPSFAPPAPRVGAQTGGNPRPTALDQRKEPTAPSARYGEPRRGGELSKMLSGEVFGAPVPVALAVAFLIALAMVVLVYIVAG